MRTPRPASTSVHLGTSARSSGPWSAVVLATAPLALGLLFAACSDEVTIQEGASPDAKNYCAIVGACQLKPAFGFGECINELARNQITLAATGGDVADQQRYDCVKAAGTNCEKAKQCIGRVETTDARCTDPGQGDPYPGQQTRSFCDGDRITVCDQMSTASQTFSCGDDFAAQHFGGPKCVKNAGASALCGFQTCGDDAGAIVPSTCAGNVLQYCVNGVQQRTDCAALGGTCDPNTGKCGGTCASTGYTCDGTELIKSCEGGSKLTVYDCAARPGWTCRPPPDMTTFGCVPPAKECEWGVYQASCVEGSKIRYCDDGKVKVFDCKEAGAQSCVASMVGVNCAL